jgi:chemotaxis protein CheC
LDELSEPQMRVVVEILESAAQRAAGSLASLVHDEIAVYVPEMTFLKRRGLDESVQARVGSRAWVIAQNFSGALNGEACLALPSEPAMRIVRSVIQAVAPDSQSPELEIDALTEMGNIFLNAFIGEIGNFFGSEIHTSVPECTHESNFAMDDVDDGNDDDVAMVVGTDMTFRDAAADACLVVTLRSITPARFTRLVGRFTAYEQ